MTIGLIGYGKMGRTIEKIALKNGHILSHKIEGSSQLEKLLDHKPDLAIEFTQPESAFHNIQWCIENDIPVISGTTGWLESYEKIAELCIVKSGTFLHSSNFSTGVNLFFEMNEWLARKMSKLDFTISVREVHHPEKKDSPSGTAVKLTEGIIKNHERANGWINGQSTDHKKIGILSKRVSNVPGTHTISYSSVMESIDITHTAHDRSVFAEGVVRVAEWINGQTGVYTMTDFING